MMSKAWFKRQKVWHHNGLRGSVVMAKANMNRIIEASTTTVQAKRAAQHAIAILEDLTVLLRERVDK
jgi:hypothetical protein